jgi:alpha-L-fucosidase
MKLSCSRLNTLIILIIATVIFGQASSSVSAREKSGNSDSERASIQEDFLKLHFGLFLHFNMATFIDKEWANGYEDPALFNPKKLNCRQWAEAAEAAGMKYAVLTVKHTGGWCLWKSKYTTHDISSFINFRNGNGDLVGEFVNAFRERGLRVGFYYCFPGDFSVPPYGSLVPEGKPDLHGLPPEAAVDYIGFIKNQLSELLTNYGPVDLLWIDQYKNNYTFSHWQEIRTYIKSLQPTCLVIGNNAHDIRETDIYSCEYPFDPQGIPKEGNTVPAEVCDVISGSWFWNSAGKPEDVKSSKKIIEMLEMCNRRNANYLLNVPPDRDGLISGEQLKRMREIGELIRSSKTGTHR